MILGIKIGPTQDQELDQDVVALKAGNVEGGIPFPGRQAEVCTELLKQKLSDPRPTVTWWYQCLCVRNIVLECLAMQEQRDRTG